MNLSKFSVFLTAAVYIVIGLMFLIAPQQWAEGIGIKLTNITAIIDLQATYGGCMLALGIFLLYCFKSTETIKLALVFQALSLGGFAFARIIGILIYGWPENVIYYLLVSEIGGILLAIYCLWQISKTDRI